MKLEKECPQASVNKSIVDDLERGAFLSHEKNAHAPGDASSERCPECGMPISNADQGGTIHRSTPA